MTAKSLPLLGDRVVITRGEPDYRRWTIDALHRVEGDRYQAKITRPLYAEVPDLCTTRYERSGTDTHYVMLDEYKRRRGTRLWYRKGA